MNKDESRLWEIAENLHRAELTKLERDSNIAEWIKITERVSAQVAAKPQGGRPEGGVRAASRGAPVPRGASLLYRSSLRLQPHLCWPQIGALQSSYLHAKFPDLLKDVATVRPRRKLASGREQLRHHFL
jgi:hypothetical protein